MYLLENVLAVDTGSLRPFLRDFGLLTANLNRALALIAERSVFVPRDQAELDPEFKQIIPYVALLKGDSVFVTRRLPRGGEKRLHGLLSLGIGGHINECDADAVVGAVDGGVLLRGLYRELREEVEIENEGALRFVGLINDDGTEVGSVHLGLFCSMDVTGEVRVRETEKLEGFWMRRDELRGAVEKMERWSAIAAEALGV